MELTRDLVAQMIDHTNLKPMEGRKKMVELCEDARTFGFFAVCVNPVNTRLCADLLEGSPVQLAIVTGFPLGQNRTDMKAIETERAVADGAQEIDMVMNVAALRDKSYDFVRDDVKAVVDAAQGRLVKGILETCYLTDEEIVTACKTRVEAGAHFVKTSTGFGAFGAFPQHVKLMRETVGPDIGVKASGGMKSFRDALRMIRAGANRLGVSAGIAILEGHALMQDMQDAEALLAEDDPCALCPSRAAAAASLPRELYEYHRERCRACEHYGDQGFFD